MTSFRDITTLAVGGQIADFYDIDNSKEIIDLIKTTDKQKTPLCVIGYGANTLASDDLFSGVVIRPQNKKIEITSQGSSVIITA
ncbi:MAG: UDP-N-acetylenolpyruvoylglucosamine reductase, partial [Bifidobacteriaceae bacterium]|nr:UDP-N-acetylenolpyruvoylglucosamine reductase [Bifidobacteriaceae bacterium]